MPIFGHLTTLPIRIWDEARVAVNAYEMHKDGDYIVTHFEGKPEMWNTKPPLLLWCQVFFMKIIGVNELAVRLPSAIAALLTCVLILVFFLRYLQSFWLGFIAILVLISSQGYIHVHATRTGDYDALLTFFTTLSGLLFFIYCESHKNKYLYFFFLTTALAVLTKSITGLLFLPAFFLYSIAQKQLWTLLRNKHFYLGIATFLALVCSYYLLRETYNPGYLTAVWQNELGGRYLEVIESHGSGFWYYFDNLLEYRFRAWYLLLPLGMLIGFTIRNKKINRLTLFSALMILVYFLVISTAQTKLEWYDVPLYPYMAILIVIFIHYIFDYFQNHIWFNQTLSTNIIPYIFLYAVGLQPYQSIIAKTYLPHEENWDREAYQISNYLRDAVQGKHNLHHHYLLNEGYHVHKLFYLNILQDQGIDISIKDHTQLDSLDNVIADQDGTKKYVETHYHYDKLAEEKNIITYKIQGKKEL